MTLQFDNVSDATLMNLIEAQADMRRAYFDGATGVVVSATAWLVAGITAFVSTPKTAIVTLLVGGMFIFPLSVALSKIVGRSGIHAKDNPLATLAASGTIWMLLAIPVAYAASLYRIEWFFPAMLVTIGGRYLTFATIYGLRIYLALGAALSVAGIASVLLKLPVTYGALAGAVIEFAFGAALFLMSNKAADSRAELPSS